MTRFLIAILLVASMATQASARSHHRGHRHAHRATLEVGSPRHHRTHHEPSLGGWGGGDLVSKARAYLGTNPTGWARVWCGRFMAMIDPSAAARISNPNMAFSWAELPRVSARVGAIAVMGRRGGGHVGVVTGFDANGNPTIVSGNHNHRVGEGTYPRSRIVAYVEG